ncbi:MAG: FAD-dependent oxidoreductase [bacterium]
MADPQVVVIGAGMAGAACARGLAEAGVTVRVMDRGRAPGGRLAAPELHGRRVDLGAAYFTARDDDFRALAEQWRAAGTARPWTSTFAVAGPDGVERDTSGPMRWAATEGLRALVRDRLAGIELRLETTVQAIERVDGRPAVDGHGADVVVVALPDPQTARLRIDRTLRPEEAGSVGFDPVMTLAAGWDERQWPFPDAAFVHDHPDLEFVADDGARRGDGAPVLVAHSTATLARRFLDRPDDAATPLLAALADVFGITAEPSWTTVHRWTVAKPRATHPQTHLLGDAGLAWCGDAWCPSGSPRVESAWRSGTDLAAAIVARLA